MLTITVTGTAPDRIGVAAAAGAVEATRLTSASAANTPLFERDEVQARRLRRQFRLDRGERQSIGGWTARMW